MLKAAIKLIITLVASLVILVTGVIYLGATTSVGQLAILGTGLFIYFSLAFFYSILIRKPAGFRDWLKH